MISSPISQFWARIRNIHPRTRKAHLNTILGLGIKGGGIIISLLLVPITIDYLSTATYGTWLTISSIVTMLTFFDVGIGNGLRNKLSEAISNQDSNMARAYVSTAYVVFSAIQLFFILSFIIAFHFVPWQRILNTTVDTYQIQSVILITSIAMAIKLVLDIISYILLAIQEPSQAGFLTMLSNLLVLAGTYTLTQYTHGDIILLAAVTAISPIVVIIIGSIVLYTGRLRLYRPSINLADFRYAKGLFSIGYKFFIIQLTVIILFYTDNLIITQLFGPSEVTTYNVAFRYFNAANMLFMIATTPYWSAFTDAFVKNDSKWMKQTYYYLQKLWLALVVVIIIMILISDKVYLLWVGDRVKVSFSLNICVAVFVIISCWNSINSLILNGLGKIKLQLIVALFCAAVNIPLAILFGRYLQMMSGGVILATAISLLAGSIFGNIQVRKLILGHAHGIWDR